MYIPHGNYPKEVLPFNSLKMCPELFEKIDFREFTLGMGKRINDFFDSELFLFSSLYQENYGAKLVMLLSAIERTSGKWKSLEDVLNSKEFKNKLASTKDGKEAKELLVKTIKEYHSNFGTLHNINDFFKNNLAKKDKLRIIRSIKIAHIYKREKVKDGYLFKPESPKENDLQTNEEVNKALGLVIRNLIYKIRNSFVHKASYIPFPDRKYLLDKKIFTLDVGKNGFPKESWIITMPFENLHEITLKAFTSYWEKEYKSLNKTK